MHKLINCFGSAFLLFAVISFCGCSGIVKELDVPYGKADGQELLLDVYRPGAKSASLRPAVIIVHGGAWQAGDKSEGRDLGNALAKMGYVAFSINYRLAGEKGNHWPAQLDDTQRAVRWIRANAAKYGIDPERLGALGGSAGGHIVACLGTMDTRDNSDAALAAYSSRPQCVVMLAGPTDLTEDLRPKVKQGEWCNEQIKILLGGTPQELPEVANGASPLYHVDAQSKPALIFQGKTDEIVPVDHGERFDAALKKAGVESKLIIHKGGHGFDDEEDISIFIKETSAFLKKHLQL